MQIIEIHNEYLVWDFVRYCMWARARSFSSSALSLSCSLPLLSRRWRVHSLYNISDRIHFIFAKIVCIQSVLIQGPIALIEKYFRYFFLDIIQKSKIELESDKYFIFL